MYRGRMDCFQCDTCKKIEYVHNGFPKGWCYLKTGGVVEHACEICRKEIPKDRQFEAGQK